jgi:hypothetical protein
MFRQNSGIAAQRNALTIPPHVLARADGVVKAYIFKATRLFKQVVTKLFRLQFTDKRRKIE